MFLNIDTVLRSKILRYFSVFIFSYSPFVHVVPALFVEALRYGSLIFVLPLSCSWGEGNFICAAHTTEKNIVDNSVAPPHRLFCVWWSLVPISFRGHLWEGGRRCSRTVVCIMSGNMTNVTKMSQKIISCGQPQDELCRPFITTNRPSWFNKG